ncbi:uncharacterized protein LOC126554253, partial [Aphis gossypii]|uniref:uncharacterized protein LOC126554253 n=1 Tax=Aphis gossypii TaxID=80765 RepID=UPI0021590795
MLPTKLITDLTKVLKNVTTEMNVKEFGYHKRVKREREIQLIIAQPNGKVKLIPLDPPPEPLQSLVSGIGTDSIHFLANIQQYNNCFQMTSFGATNVVRENFMPTFKIQGQIYHRAGSLLPVSDSDNKFLQIYFMGNSPQEIDLRCAHNNLVKRSIVEQLQTLFHQHNQLIILFKTALDLMPSDNHKIVIRADKTPTGQHTRRFNAPTIDEVAIVVVGENLESRDIVLRRRNDQLQRIKKHTAHMMH